MRHAPTAFEPAPTACQHARMNPIGRLFIAGHVALYRRSGGKRGGKVGRLPVILLTTRGRKSGAERTVPLVPFREGDAVYVMASMGGQPRHPDWYFNLEANPDVTVQLGADRYRAHAEILSPERHAQIWPKVTSAMPNFAQYQTKTSRVIPVVQLVRAG
jgi:deazaflavin-dependent oxidoreductase (nitroreductase family)